ncbi:hypothetical protein VNO78_23466 [Psophocarpus tetragonolobus]|uniref:Uncharacterized protein n=1 Tax=Psophocarpus tetragonolobus TaxID=3891 RepID=A0AAN9S6P4_PSOTE
MHVSQRVLMYGKPQNFQWGPAMVSIMDVNDIRSEREKKKEKAVGTWVGLSSQLELVLLFICMEPNSALEAYHRLKVGRVLRLLGVSGAREIIQQGYHMYAMSLLLYYSSNSLSSLSCTTSLSIACQGVHTPQHIQLLHLRSAEMPHIYRCGKVRYKMIYSELGIYYAQNSK